MKLIRRVILIIAVTATILLCLYPPWMCIDLQSEGRVHAGLGNHAIWHPPSSEFAFRTLYPDVADLPAAERLADFVPRINKVGFTLSAFALALVASISQLVLRKRSLSRD